MAHFRPLKKGPWVRSLSAVLNKNGLWAFLALEGEGGWETCILWL